MNILPKTAKYLKEQKVQEVCFVIVGAGRNKDELLAQINECDVADMFIMVDRQPAERIPELLAACDAAFVSFMPDSLFEKTIPAKLQSYMACAMPIGAAANGETERIVQEANCGMCSPIGDSIRLAHNITALMRCDNLQELGKNARTYLENYFDKKALIDDLEKLLFGEAQI